MLGNGPTTSAVRGCQYTIPAISRSIHAAPRPGRHHWCKAKPGPDDQDASLQAQRQALNSLFYATTDAKQSKDDVLHPSVAQATDAADHDMPELVEDLPLWRVQWAALPGTTEILQVHVPHYCHMFLQLVNGPRPWRFGHVYLPGGSQNLGNDQYALQSGTGAPLIGTLMEVARIIQLQDGRLFVIARGLSRLRVLCATQVLPYSRAHCLLLPDDEEKEVYREAAVCTAADLTDGNVRLEGLMTMVNRACNSAAAAAAATWTEFECARVDLDLGQPRLVRCSSVTEEMAAAHDLTGVEAGVPFPDCNSPSSDVVVHATQAAAANAAHMALTKALLILSEPGASQRARMQPWQVINSVSERGGPSLPSADEEDQALLDGFATAVAADGPQALLELELQVWQELDALWRLAAKVSSTPPPMPAAIMSLRPKGLADNSPAHSNDRNLQNGPQIGLRSSQANTPQNRPQNGPHNEDEGTEGASSINAEAGSSSSSTDRTAVRDAAGDSDCAAPLSGEAAGPNAGLHTGDTSAPAGAACDAAAGDDSSGVRGEQHGASGLTFLRLQRLSYMLVQLLPSLSKSEGYQAVLELPSITQRLLLLLGNLRKQRRVMAAVVALQGLNEGPDTV